MRILEEGVLHQRESALLRVQRVDRELHTPLKKRRGIHRFILEHKRFNRACENRGNPIGFAENLKRKETVKKTSHEGRDTQAMLIKEYIHELCHRLGNSGKLTEKQAYNLKALLKNMTQTDPDRRISLERAKRFLKKSRIDDTL